MGLSHCGSPDLCSKKIKTHTTIFYIFAAYFFEHYYLELDTARTYDGHPFVETANQLHVTGLAPTDHFTGGTITTDSYVAKDYLCQDGNFQAMMEDGIAVQSGFAIDNGLGNYVPDFNVALRILPITEGFDCPDDLEIVLLDVPPIRW